MTKLYSNEIVFRGHPWPDKVADQISDALLDAYLTGDKHSRCAIECVGGKNKIFITGEVTSTANVDVESIVKRVLADVGYNPRIYEVINNLGTQSSDIALGTNDDIGGAGDQGMMFGYACNDTAEKLPTAMVILQKLSKAYDYLRQVDERFLPDGKAQITGYYDGKKLIKIKDFTISYQNTEQERESTDNIIKDMATNICKEYGIEIEQFLINPTGKFLIGGFEGDAGLTGRKIVVDQYQSFANVGGGAFSGKDPTKVDRSGAYKARLIAIHYLKKYNLKWCRVQFSYAIGIRKPLAIYIDSNVGTFNDEVTIDKYKDLYEECEPKNIIDDLNLLNESFYEKSKFGHF